MGRERSAADRAPLRPPGQALGPWRRYPPGKDGDPAALRGTGFYEKVQTDHVLRDLVCRRAISLVQAQHDLEKNWYAAWLTYVVAADHP
jgi:hypothetical protein